MAKKVLITGGAGYIGSHSSLELLRDNHEVLIYDNFSNSSEVVIERLQLLANKSVSCVKGDIRDKSSLASVLASFKPDTVLHFAGLKSVATSVEEPIKYYEVNVAGTLNLLNEMDVVGCKEIVFSSSATVYSKSVVPPYKETDPVNPSSPYGRSKLMTENILRDWSASDRDTRAICLRYFNPIGAHKSGLIGESPLDVPNNIMPVITQVASGHLEHLTIFGNNYDTRDGTGERDFVHVLDVAFAHAVAVSKIKDLSNFNIFNIGTGRGTTVKELLSEFERVTEKKINHVYSHRRPGDVARSIADPSKYNRILDSYCAKSVGEMCSDAWNWQKQNPRGYVRSADVQSE